MRGTATRRLAGAVVLASAACLLTAVPGPGAAAAQASAGTARVHDPGPTPCRGVGRTLVGMRVRAAEKRAIERGCLFRVVVRDGRRLPTTEDHLHLRINVRVADGVVRKVVRMG